MLTILTHASSGCGSISERRRWPLSGWDLSLTHSDSGSVTGDLQGGKPRWSPVTPERPVQLHWCDRGVQGSRASAEQHAVSATLPSTKGTRAA